MDSQQDIDYRVADIAKKKAKSENIDTFLICFYSN